MADHGLATAIKLASNESPFDPLPSVRDAISRASGGVNRYPDHRAVAVREALAARLGLAVEQVAVGCGSVGLLQQALLAFVDPGDEVLYGWRSFEAYPIYTAIVGGAEVTAPLRHDTVDLGALEARLTERTRVVLVTSPNNPTGTAVSHDDLERLLGAVPTHCLVVLDEAYHEYVTASHVPDALGLLRRHPNLAVLRTFSKAYGLAALRVGYLMAHPQVVAAVDQALIPFAVNGIGQAAALASLEPVAAAELQERVRATIAERTRVVASLRSLGLSVPDAQANFVWLPAGDAAATLAMKLEAMGVVTRPFPGEGVRVTIGSPADNDLLLGALEACSGPLELAEHWALPVGDGARRVASYIERIEVAKGRLVEHASARYTDRTQPDAGGSETWDDGQLWAHLAEIGGYWLGQLDLVVRAAEASTGPVELGRVKTDPGRLAAIEAGRQVSPADQLAIVWRSLDSLAAYVAGLPRHVWSATGRHSTLGVMDVSRQLDEFHIGHVEQHLDQLDLLAARR
jgi:histidinol-phosphate aminotransferase